MHECAGIFSVLHIKDTVRTWTKKQNDKFNKTNIQMKLNKTVLFPWRSTNITVQVSNSYKSNLKVLNVNEHCIVFTVCIDIWCLLKL